MSQPCPTCPGLFHFRHVCLSCGRQPAALALSGEIGSDCFPEFRKAMDFVCAMNPCLRVYIHLGRVLKIDGLLPILILEFITRHRELRPIITGVPKHLRHILSEIHHQLSDWITVTEKPFPYGPNGKIKRIAGRKRMATFHAKPQQTPWQIEIFLLETV